MKTAEEILLNHFGCSNRCSEKTGELFKDSDLDFLFEGVKKELK